MNVGYSGRMSDGGVLKKTEFYNALQNNELNIPITRKLPHSEQFLRMFLVADDAFAQSSFLIKPYGIRNLSYTERIFNYRLSRARRIIENVFGIMSKKFRILGKPMLLNPEKATSIVSAICALHNYLIDTKSERYLDIQEDENQNNQLHQNENNENDIVNDDGIDGQDIRRILTDYFVNEGDIEFQYGQI